MPLRGWKREAITSADKQHRKGGDAGETGRREGTRDGGDRGDLISRGKFLMQGDPREIKTASLITGGTARD